MTLLDKMIKISNSGLMLCALIPFFFACNDPNALGLELDDQTSKTEVDVVEFTLPAKTIYINSLNTGNRGSVVLGKITNDSIFGDIKARVYSQYYPSSGTLPSFKNDSTNGDTLSYVSATLRLKYSRLTVNPNDSSMANDDISVHLTTDSLFSSVEYLANMHTAFDEANPVGNASKKFKIRQDSITEIPLNDDFGSMLFARLDSAGRSETTAYRDTVTSGIRYARAITIEPGVDFNHLVTLPIDSMWIEVEMKSKKNDKPYYYKFKLGGTYYSQIIRNRSTGKYSDLIQDYDSSSVVAGNVHLNSIAGFYPKVELTEYLKFVNDNQDITINRAEFSYAHDPIVSDIIPAVQLVNYYFPKEDERISISQALSTRGTYALFSNNGYTAALSSESMLASGYDKEDQIYQDDVTLFCKSLADYQRAGEEPFAKSIVFWNANTTSVGQTSIPKSSIKLKVYYTRLK